MNVYIVYSQNPFSKVFSIENVFQDFGDAEKWVELEKKYSELDYYIEEWRALAPAV